MNESSEQLSSLFSSFLTILGSSVVGSVLAMVARILIIRSLQPGRFGLVVLAFTISSVIAQLAVLGLPRGVVQRYSSTDDQSERFDYIGTAYRITFLAGITSALLVYVFRTEIATLLGEPELGIALGFFTLYLIVHPLSSVTVGVLRGSKSSAGAAIARDIGPKAGGLLVLGTLVVAGRPYFGAIVYWVLLPVLSLGLGVWYLWDVGTIKRIILWTPSRARAADLVRYSWPLALENGLTLLMINVDVILIGYFLNQEMVGLYRSTHPIWKTTLLFLFSFGFMYFPLASRYHANDERDSLRTFYTVTTKWIVTITFPLTAVIVLYAEPILRELYAASYTPAHTTLSILAVGMFLRVIVGPNASTIQAIELTKIDLFASAVGLLTNVVLNVLLIPRWGIIGAAVATSTGFVVYNSIELIILYRHAGVHPFTWNLLKPLLLTTGIASGIAWLLTPEGILELALTGFLIAAIHLVSLVVTQSTQPKDIIIVEQIESQLGVDLHWIKRYVQN